MARLLAVAASKPTRFDPYLLAAAHGLAVRDRDAPESWGIATASPAGWALQSGTARRDAIHQVLATPKSKILLAHVVPVSREPDGAVRKQPLRMGEWLFLHDGRSRSARWDAEDHTDRRARRNNIETSSDFLFAHLLTALERRGVLMGGPHNEVDCAVADAVDALAARGGSSSLNFVLSNRAAVYAFRLGRPLYQLARNPMIGMARHVAFASEPLTDEPWTPIPDGTLVRAVDRAEPPIRVTVCPPVPARGWVH